MHHSLYHYATTAAGIWLAVAILIGKCYGLI